MFAYVHQVQTQQKFRVTVSKFGALGMDMDWRVYIEQLTYEELKNVSLQIDPGTPTNGGSGFPSGVNPRTFDGRAQTEFYTSWQPSTIIMVWDGGRESFVFNHYPFEVERPPQPHPFNSEKVAITQVSFDKANPDTILVNVKCLSTYLQDETIHFTVALVKNIKGENVADVHIPETVLGLNETTTLRITTPTSLPPGNYTVTIITGCGSDFVSPSFEIP